LEAPVSVHLNYTVYLSYTVHLSYRTLTSQTQNSDFAWLGKCNNIDNKSASYQLTYIPTK